MNFSDRIAVKNIIVDWMNPFQILYLTGRNSRDVNIDFIDSSTSQDIEIHVENDISIQGFYKNKITIVGLYDITVFLLGNITVVEHSIIIVAPKTTVIPNGFLYRVVPTQVYGVKNTEIFNGIDLDFTGALNYHDQFNVSLIDTAGDVSINAGRIDYLAEFPFDNRANVQLTGTTSGNLSINGVRMIDVNLIGGNAQNIDIRNVEVVADIVANKTGGNVTFQLSSTGNLETIKANFSGRTPRATIASGAGTVFLTDKLYAESVSSSTGTRFYPFENIVIDVISGDPNDSLVRTLAAMSVPVNELGVPLFKSAVAVSNPKFSATGSTIVKLNSDKWPRLGELRDGKAQATPTHWSNTYPVGNEMCIIGTSVGAGTAVDGRATQALSVPLSEDGTMCYAEGSGGDNPVRWVAFNAMTWPVTRDLIPILKVVN
jgi:hypothetical protein